MVSRLPMYEDRASGQWRGEERLPSRYYQCGYCGANTASDLGYHTGQGPDEPTIYICGGCNRPTFFHRSSQVPSPPLGNPVSNLPVDISKIYEEARQCCSVEAYTSSVLTSRKVLMHIAVDTGAEEGLNFIEYVDFLVDNHYAPPNSKDWVDQIRTQANEANHEVKLKSYEDADLVLVFTEMLLKFIYEFPSRGRQSPSA